MPKFINFKILAIIILAHVFLAGGDKNKKGAPQSTQNFEYTKKDADGNDVLYQVTKTEVNGVTKTKTTITTLKKPKNSLEEPPKKKGLIDSFFSLFKKKDKKPKEFDDLSDKKGFHNTLNGQPLNYNDPRLVPIDNKVISKNPQKELLILPVNSQNPKLLAESQKIKLSQNNINRKIENDSIKPSLAVNKLNKHASESSDLDHEAFFKKLNTNTRNYQEDVDISVMIDSENESDEEMPKEKMLTSLKPTTQGLQNIQLEAPLKPKKVYKNLHQESCGKEVFKLFNKFRKEKGLSQLQWSPVVYIEIMDHTDNMANKNKLSHDKFESRYKNINGATKAAENVGMFTHPLQTDQDRAQKLMTGWINSRGHYANMIIPDMSHIAIDCAYSEKNQGWYSTMYLVKMKPNIVL